MIDSKAIQNLIELENSESLYFVKELASIFQEQTPLLIQKMHEGIDKEDLRMVFSGAHTLKSSCAYLGITEMQSLCEKLEEWSQKRNDRSQAEGISLLQSLDKNYSSSKDELHKIIEDIGSHRIH